MHRTEDAVSARPAQAEQGTVDDNLAGAALTVFGAGATQTAALIMSRPALGRAC